MITKMNLIAAALTWPEAFAFAVIACCIAIAFIALMVAVNNSKWPWEK
jgi:hypothetical protein